MGETVRKKLMPLACGLLLFSGAAGAANGYLDLYFVPSAKLDLTIPGVGSGSDDGSGFGARLLAPLSGTSAAISGEYQSVGYDDSGIDFDQFRVGLGIIGESRSGVFVEFVSADLDGSKADGLAVQARLEGGGGGGASFYGQLGYAKLDDDAENLSGLEFTIGIALPINDQTGAFLDYRRSQLEGHDSGVEFEFTDLRAGIRINF